MMTKVFPTLQGLMCFAAFVVYAIKLDVGRSIYWLAACILTMSVTYLIK